MEIPADSSALRCRCTELRRLFSLACNSLAARLAASISRVCLAVGFAVLANACDSRLASSLAFFRLARVTASCALALRKPSICDACALRFRRVSCVLRMFPLSALLAFSTERKGRDARSTAFSSTCNRKLLTFGSATQ